MPSSFLSVSMWSLLSPVNHPKAFITSEGYPSEHLNKQNCYTTRGGIVRAQGICRNVSPLNFLLWPQCSDINTCVKHYAQFIGLCYRCVKECVGCH